MAGRRKGEQPVTKHVVDWTAGHPVAHSMKTGSRWFNAWIAQTSTPYERLAKRTRISAERIREIELGASFSRAELEALANAWWITPEGLIASMPDPSIVID